MTTLLRLGLQLLAVRNAASKRRPCAARRSMCGVRAVGLPVQPRSSQLTSSAIKRMTLGRGSAAGAAKTAGTAARKRTAEQKARSRRGRAGRAIVRPTVKRAQGMSTEGVKDAEDLEDGGDMEDLGDGEDAGEDRLKQD